METLGTLSIIISLVVGIIFLVMAYNLSLLRNKIVRDSLTPVDIFRRNWAFNRSDDSNRQLLIEAIYYEWRLVSKKPEGKAGKSNIEKVKRKYKTYMEELNVQWPEDLK